LGLFTNIASVVQYLKAAEHAGMASVYYSANNSAFNPDGLKYRALFRVPMINASAAAYCFRTK
jgi:hypothetical protein